MARMFIMFTENEIEFYQDFSWHKGIPPYVLFEIKNYRELKNGTLYLIAPCYGGKPYGNGSLKVKLKDIFGSRTKQKMEVRHETD